MVNCLESPYAAGRPNWNSLYRARGEEINAARPILTGDVFADMELPGSTGKIKKRCVIVLQHPCSMREGGTSLRWQLLVAKVKKRSILEESAWRGNYALMPLPDLFPHAEGKERNYAATFNNLYTVAPSTLVNRVACLDPLGLNLLLQRWVHDNSRVIVPTSSFQEQSASYYEEADLMEEWCDERGAETVEEIKEAQDDCLKWLREEIGSGMKRQEMLKDNQKRSTVRREMRAHFKAGHRAK